jgi:acetolactate synthase-1/2/3 large subunit
MVRQWQDLFWNKRYSFTCIDASDCATCPQAPQCVRRGRQAQPDFRLLAEAFGAVGMTVKEKSEIEPALREAIGCGRPAVIDFRTSAEENVYPMVPAGQEITEMIGGTSRKQRRKP